MGRRRTGVRLEPWRTGVRGRRDVPRRGRSPAAGVPAGRGVAAARTRSGPDPGPDRARTADRPAADYPSAARPPGHTPAEGDRPEAGPVGHEPAGHGLAGPGP